MSSMLIPNILTFEADGAIAKGSAVKIGTSRLRVAVCSATTDASIGIAQNAPSAAGDLVEVAMPGGGAKALAKATIAAGDILGQNADGSIQKLASANDRIVGYALESAVAADVFSMVVQIAQGVATQS